MIREEEMKSVINMLFGDEGRMPEQVAAANGFEAGVRWADRHIDTTILWHDASNEPEEGELIVCVDYDNDFYTGDYYANRVDELNRVYENAVWDCGALICYWDDVRIWAYAKDILPKGGDSWK